MTPEELASLTDLIQWLRDRLTDDEAVQHTIIGSNGYTVDADPPDQFDWAWPVGRVLAEISARRARLSILAVELGRYEHDWPYAIDAANLIKLEAWPYTGAPGWRDEWRIV